MAFYKMLSVVTAIGRVFILSLNLNIACSKVRGRAWGELICTDINIFSFYILTFFYYIYILLCMTQKVPDYRYLMKFNYKVHVLDTDRCC